MPASFLNISSKNISKNAFTLVELLAVVAVVIILTGITFGISKGIRNQQARTQAKAELAMIAQALEEFKLTYGDYPLISIDGDPATGYANAKKLTLALSGYSVYAREDDGDFVLKDIDPGQQKSFIDPSRLNFSKDFGNPSGASDLDDVFLVDPWRQPYVYVYARDNTDWDNVGYILFSKGPNGTADLDDLDEDTAGIQMDGTLNQSTDKNIDNIYPNQ